MDIHWVMGIEIGLKKMNQMVTFKILRLPDEKEKNRVCVVPFQAEC